MGAGLEEKREKMELEGFGGSEWYFAADSAMKRVAGAILASSVSKGKYSGYGRPKQQPLAGMKIFAWSKETYLQQDLSFRES